MNQLLVAAFHRRIERGKTACLAGVDVGAGSDETPDDLHVMAGCGAV